MDEDKPPLEDNLDTGTGFLSAFSSLAQRFKRSWALLADDNSFCCLRSPVFSRRLVVFADIQGEMKSHGA